MKDFARVSIGLNTKVHIDTKLQIIKTALQTRDETDNLLIVQRF